MLCCTHRISLQAGGRPLAMCEDPAGGVTQHERPSPQSIQVQCGARLPSESFQSHQAHRLSSSSPVSKKGAATGQSPLPSAVPIAAESTARGSEDRPDQLPMHSPTMSLLLTLLRSCSKPSKQEDDNHSCRSLVSLRKNSRISFSFLKAGQASGCAACSGGSSSVQSVWIHLWNIYRFL